MHIFLDVDGVLNREADWRKSFSINEDCLRNFASVVSCFRHVHVILSSTWRVGYTNTGVMSASGNALTDRLREYNIVIEGSTPVSNKSRQEEIEYYIRRNNVSNYIVLDDDESLFPWKERINLYLVNHKTGLTEADAKRICKIFKRQL